MKRWIVLASLLVPAIALGNPTLPTVKYERQPKDKVVRAGGQFTLFLNNCENGGCQILPGDDDASKNQSSIATKAANMQPFPWADGEWEAVLQCVRDVYSPYAVTVTDQRPSTEFNMAVVGGTGEDIGYIDPNAGGVALVPTDCRPLSNFITYIFTNSSTAGLDVFASEDCGGCSPQSQDRIYGACWVIAQETAHLYGLDHEFHFTDIGKSACNDPMTYLDDCGGQKFFRNNLATCGEFGPARPGCGSDPNRYCSTQQNSHQLLLSNLGPGTPTTAPPEVSVLLPHAGDTIKQGAVVQSRASAQRGVAKVELYLNGFKWDEKPGADFGVRGQSATVYPFELPDNVPDGVIDIVVKAYDDIGAETDSEAIRVTKGKPCSDAATDCADGQQCDSDGRCFWDPPTGVLGDSCTYDQFCTSLLCAGTDDANKQCSQSCTLGVSDACPSADFECVDVGTTDGACLKKGGDGGGCCSSGNTTVGALTLQGGMAFGVLAMVLRRRRRTV